MASDIDDTNLTLLKSIKTALADMPDAIRLAEALYARSQPDTAAKPATLAADIAETLSFLGDKPSGKHKLRVRAGAGGATVIEILNDDMPFLVDSVMGEIQVRGLGVRFVSHPILRTSRTQPGQLQALLGLADQTSTNGQASTNAALESLIVVHLDPISPEIAGELGRALSDVLADVRVAVDDFPAMSARVEHAASTFAGPAAAFIRWLCDGHFIFLGLADLATDAEGALKPVEGQTLGVMRDPALQVLHRGGQELALTRETGALSPIVVSKASAQTRVHRRVHMDYIALTTGTTTPGELRIVGLFTSKAYATTARDIPLVAHKLNAVLAQSGFPAQSHAGKALVNILDTFPRDELFQIATDDLARWSMGILDLDTRPRVKLFARPDRFERFVSVMLYAPRERWTTDVREKVGTLLAVACHGRIAAFTPFFLEGPLLRAHFIVATPTGAAPPLDLPAMEAQITQYLRTFDDDFSQAMSGSSADATDVRRRYAQAFPRAYAETFDATRAVVDMRRIEKLAATKEPVSIDFYRAPGDPPHRVHAAIYRFGDAIRLSERVPVLENLGFTVIDERSYRLTPDIGGTTRDVALHDMILETADGAPLDLAQHDDRLEDAFRSVVAGTAESDAFNRLIVAAGANWREAMLMRANASYLRQLNAPFGVRYIAETLLRHAGVIRDLIELFHLRFDPRRSPEDLAARMAAAVPVRARIDGALGAIASADEDRILRLLLSVMDATVRTNFYLRDADGNLLETLALKVEPRRIDSAPAPRPYREIWVYSPRVEGVHMRFAAVARGGLRWSDRAQDFRTEVLGLVKAQLVKNAVIVPSGAKGGFLPKQLPRIATRDGIMKEGIAAYRLFIGALLDVTDNIVDGVIVPPKDVVRHDGDDPYLVVAADKGTATFSDFANAISAERGHWLGDAFASGGSVGYDHKKMAITARGAWECVKRHFREMDWDIQVRPFRVVGVGDMSGDVFGNGMLLSPAIRLIAAFDHRDIFLDPDPDATSSFAERKRLFDLPRSSWQDYDRLKISSGGGVFPRAAKSIPLTAEMRTLLRLEPDTATPAEIMRAILKCEADLCWFGGIGTYVRGAAEADDQVGDRANDTVRVTAAELGAKVIGEGANLGLTQRSRVELAERGVRLNTDFIDNSAGVNSSDVEVNIKITLGRADRSGELSGPARAAFLATMTDDVAARCLANNIGQSLALSLAERQSATETREQMRLMQALETRGLLDRRLEVLPRDTELAARQKAGRPLTRPELAVLLSYAKIALTDDLIASHVPDLTETAPRLTMYMPSNLSATYTRDVETHRLRREIIATALTNAAINHLGSAFPNMLATETGCSTADVVVAYLAAESALGFTGLRACIDALDNTVAGSMQLDLYLTIQRTLRAVVRDLVHDRRVLTDLGSTTRTLHETAGALARALPPAMQPTIAARVAELTAKRVPHDAAVQIARLPTLADVTAIDRLAGAMKRSAAEVTTAHLSLGDELHLPTIKAKAQALQSTDDFDAIALAEALQQLGSAHARLTRSTLVSGVKPAGLDDAKALLARLAADEGISISRLVVAASRLGAVGKDT